MDYRRDTAPPRLLGAEYTLSRRELPYFLPSSLSRSLPPADPPLVPAIGTWGQRRGWRWRSGSKTEAPAGHAGLLGGTIDCPSLPASATAMHRPLLCDGVSPRAVRSLVLVVLEARTRPLG